MIWGEYRSFFEEKKTLKQEKNIILEGKSQT